MVTELENQISDMKANMAEMAGTIEACDAMIAERDETIRELEEQIDQYENEYEWVIRDLADHDYDSVIERLEEMKEEEKKAEFASKGIEEVVITLDNWQEYFEFCEYTCFKENGFGEFERFINSYSFSCKDGMVIDADNSDVTVEYVYSQHVKPYEVDFETRTVTYGEATETYKMKPIVESMKMKSVDYFGEETYKYGIGEFEINSYSYLQGDDAWIIADFEVTRISGKLCIEK